MVKKKTVERVKPKKRKETPIIETVQIKQPLSNGSQNANNQIVQVIFPSDVELRKVRKKKRKTTPKKDNKKDELLTELKQRLEQYDKLQQEAQQLNIKIPPELGVSVINQSDLKTNDDIQNYINDIIKKISLLQQLIEKSKIPASIPSTGLFDRMGSGLIGLPTLPPLQPSIPSMQPPLQPMRPPQTPAQTQTPPDPTKARLDEIARQIEGRLGRNTGRPATTAGRDLQQQTQTPAETAQALGLRPLKVQKGSITLDVNAPAGWDKLYSLYTMYTRATEQQTLNNQFTPEVYHIPRAELKSLLDSRDTLRTNYLSYLNILQPEQKAYLEDPNNINIHQLHTDILTNTNIEPAELAKKLFTESGIKYKEITAGGEEPMIVKQIDARGADVFTKQEDKDEYEKYSNEYFQQTTKLQQLKTKIESNPSRQNLNNAGRELNKIESKLQTIYDSLDGIVKVGVTVEHNKFLERINQVRQDIANQGLPNIADPISGLFPPQTTPLQPAKGTGEGGDDAGAEPAQPAGVKDKQKVKNYVNNPKGKYGKKLKEAVIFLFGQDEADEIDRLSPRAKRGKIRDLYNRRFPGDLANV